LLKATSKLSIGIANLKAILGSQNCVFNKAGIGYKTIFRKKVKTFNCFFNYNKRETSPFVTYFYCMRKGHSVTNCNIRKIDVPKGLSRWVPKGTINNTQV